MEFELSHTLRIHSQYFLRIFVDSDFVRCFNMCEASFEVSFVKSTSGLIDGGSGRYCNNIVQAFASFWCTRCTSPSGAQRFIIHETESGLCAVRFHSTRGCLFIAAVMQRKLYFYDISTLKLKQHTNSWCKNGKLHSSWSTLFTWKCHASFRGDALMKYCLRSVG